MAEACEIGKYMGVSFTAQKGSDGSLRIQKIDKNHSEIDPTTGEMSTGEKIIPMKEVDFMREYKRLKRH